MKRFLIASSLLFLFAAGARSQAPVVNQPAAQQLCNGSNSAPIPFSGDAAGTAYSWTNSDPSIGLPASGTGPIPAFVARNSGGSNVVASIEVTPSVAGNAGTPKTFTITVKPTPRVDAVSNQVLCAGATLPALSFGGNVPGGSFTWTNDNTATGLPASGSGDIAPLAVQNSSIAVQTSVITVWPQDNGCPAKPAVFRVQVKPVPTIEAPADQALCAGSSSAASNFASPVPGTYFSWTNSNPAIGLGNVGTGNIPSFTVRNETASEIQSTVQVTPMAAGCAGAPRTFTYRVQPGAGSIAYAGSPFCPSGPAYVTASGSGGGSFSASPAGLSIDAATGAVNLAYSQPGSYTVTYARTSGGTCPASTSTTLVVKDLAGIDAVPNQQLWTGNPSGAIVFSGNATRFSWTNSNPSIGLAASGNGLGIASFTAVNNGTEVTESIIRVTPEGDEALTCPGKPIVFRIRVSPLPSVAAVTDRQYCSGSVAEAVVFSGPLTGTDFAWTNSDPSIGLPASGRGSLPSFTASNVTMAVRRATITVTPSVTDQGQVYSGTPVSFEIEVNPLPQASISYGGALCTSDGLAPVLRNGTAGGTFSATPAGLSLDPSSGSLDLGACVPGTYSVAYRIAAYGGCDELTTSTTVVVDAPQTAAIAYGGSPYCLPTGTATVSRTGASGGSYSAAPAGLVLDAATGDIDLATSAPGIYTITYSFGQGTGCPRSVSTQVSVLPGQLLSPVPNQVLCAGSVAAPIVFNGQPGLSYVWTNDNTAIGLAASGTTDIAGFTTQNNSGLPEVANIKVTPVGGTGCVSKFITFRMTVNPVPVVNAVGGQSLCAGSNVMAIAFSGTAGSTFKWTNDNPAIGLGATGTNSIAAFEAQNNTGSTQVANISVTPQAAGCTGAAQAFSITVHPSAGNIAYSGGPFCMAGTANVQRSGSLGGTFSATPAGLNINASTGALNLALSQPGTYTVTYAPTVSGGGCAATATTTVVVRPPATADPLANLSLCAGASTPAIAFTGTASTYSWTNTNPAIGLAASGTGTGIAAFVAENATSDVLSATIYVTPLGDGVNTCDGKTTAFRILVSPRPVVAAVADQVYCRGVSATPVTFTSPVAGTTFSWTNSNPAIGLAASGTGAVPSFGTQNASGAPLEATITVTPKASKCAGTPVTFRYIINNCTARRQAVAPEGTETTLSTDALQVGPNPARNYVDVRVGGPARRLELQLLDAGGNPVQPLQRGGNSFRVGLQGLPAGIYLLRISDAQSGATQFQRIVRQ